MGDVLLRDFPLEAQTSLLGSEYLIGRVYLDIPVNLTHNIKYAQSTVSSDLPPSPLSSPIAGFLKRSMYWVRLFPISLPVTDAKDLDFKLPF